MNLFSSLHVFVVFVIAAASGFSSYAVEETVAPAEPKAWNFQDMGLTPVQAGGRIKPFDTFARETVLYITGSRVFMGWNSSDLVLSWITNPQAWESRAFIQLNRADVKRQLGLDEKRSRFSPGELLRDSFLTQYARENESTSKAPGSVTVQSKPDPREVELKNLLQKIGSFRTLVSGESLALIPVLPPAQWGILAGTNEQGREIRHSFANALLAHREGDRIKFEMSSLLARQQIEAKISNFQSSLQGKLRTEYEYYQLRPFLWAWIFYLVASLFLLLSATEISWGTRARTVGFIFTATAWLLHTSGFALRCYIAGRPPVTNMYESIIWVSFGVMVFALILYWRTKQTVLLTIATALTAFGLIAADASPTTMDPGIHPLVPVLRSNYWLTVHVLTITLGYAAFALSLGIANVSLFQFFKKEAGASARIHNLNQLMYRAQQFGVVLLAAGTILGGIWADYSWGRFWGWDPKEVWALIALLGYLAILHARQAGWVSQFSYASWTVVSFVLVIMAWYGVNFVLGVGLHAYGFASGGQFWVGLVVSLQLAYVAAAALLRPKSSQPSKS